MIDKVICSDALSYLKKIPDNSIDMTLTDVPYGLDKLDNNWSPDELRKKASNSHISLLPIGMKFDKKQGINFQNFMEPISKEIYRVLKPGGFFLCFSSPRLYHRLGLAIENSGFEIRDTICWLYKKSQVKAFKQDHIIKNDKIMTNEEKINLKEKLKNYKTPQLKPSFEPICVSMKPKEGRFIDNEKKWGLGLVDFSQKVGENKSPSNVMATNKITPEIEKYFLIPKPNKIEKGKNNTHPTVKPLELCEHLIKLFSKENNIILDPFIGSGTTGLAAINTKRHFYACDVNQEYVDMSNERINR